MSQNHRDSILRKVMPLAGCEEEGFEPRLQQQSPTDSREKHVPADYPSFSLST